MSVSPPPTISPIILSVRVRGLVNFAHPLDGWADGWMCCGLWSIWNWMWVDVNDKLCPFVHQLSVSASFRLNGRLDWVTDFLFLCRCLSYSRGGWSTDDTGQAGSQPGSQLAATPTQSTASTACNLFDYNCALAAASADV